MKILPINTINKTTLSTKNNLQQKGEFQRESNNRNQTYMTGIPKSYISFKASNISSDFLFTA